MTDNCEGCGKTPPTITTGPFAGQHDLFDYCVHCSANLCEECMKKPTCGDATNGCHVPSAQEDGG